MDRSHSIPAPAPARVDLTAVRIRTPAEKMRDLEAVLFSKVEPVSTDTKLYCAGILRDRMVPAIWSQAKFARLIKTLKERRDAELALSALTGDDHKAALRDLEESNKMLNEITSAIRAKIGC